MRLHTALALLMGMSAALVLPGRAAETMVGNLKVHYTVAGAGPTIIFVHGWTCDESSWQYQVPVFSKNYQVVTLDLPGHGRSDSPREADFSMDLFARSVEAVRQAIHANRVVLVGHSMGAAVIRQYALNYPKHVAGLVAADGPLDVRWLASRSGGQPPMTRDQREKMINGMFVPSTPAPMRSQIKTMMLATPDTTATGAIAAMFDPRIQSKKIIRAPALTIFAGSSMLPRDQSTKEMLPNWESTQIAGTGHFVMMERPDEFNRLLAEFLKTRARYQ